MWAEIAYWFSTYLNTYCIFILAILIFQDEPSRFKPIDISGLVRSADRLQRELMELGPRNLYLKL